MLEVMPSMDTWNTRTSDIHETLFTESVIYIILRYGYEYHSLCVIIICAMRVVLRFENCTKEPAAPNGRDISPTDTY